MLNKSKMTQIFIILLVLIILVMWKTMTLNQKSKEKLPLVVSPSLVECDYSTPCELITENGIFWLSVKKPPIKAEEWINFSVQSDQKNWLITDAKIVGKSMFMGRIPVFFKGNEANEFIAKTLVGACTSDKMVWTLQIQVEIEEQPLSLSFDFEVQRE